MGKHYSGSDAPSSMRHGAPSAPSAGQNTGIAGPGPGKQARFASKGKAADSENPMRPTPSGSTPKGMTTDNEG